METENRLIYANKLREQFDDIPPYIGLAGSLVQQYIDKAPTVDAVEVVRGRWKYGTRAAVCSVCGFERHLDDNFGAAISCPNCSAKMDGDVNDQSDNLL